MAQLLRVDGSIEIVHPSHEQQWTEGELKALVGEYNSSRTASGDYLLHSDWTDLHKKLGKDSLTFEELCRWRPFNPTAAKATGYLEEFGEAGLDWVFGDALLIPRAEVALTTENFELFGDWGETRQKLPVMVEYACQADECGMIFFFGHTGKHSHPDYCPFCGKESPLPTRSITKKHIDIAAED